MHFIVPYFIKLNVISVRFRSPGRCWTNRFSFFFCTTSGNFGIWNGSRLLLRRIFNCKNINVKLNWLKKEPFFCRREKLIRDAFLPDDHGHNEQEQTNQYIKIWDEITLGGKTKPWISYCPAYTADDDGRIYVVETFSFKNYCALIFSPQTSTLTNNLLLRVNRAVTVTIHTFLIQTSGKLKLQHWKLRKLLRRT